MHLPGDGQCTIKPSAFIFMGGKLSDFSGIMPGIMEEFLHAAKAGRPIYLFGGLGGAARVIAEALCAGPKGGRPEEFTVEYYRKQEVKRKHDDYKALLAELKRGDPQPQQHFDELWSVIQQHRTGGLDRLFNNGLSHHENLALITNENTLESVRLVWKGISRTLLLPTGPTGPAKPASRRRTTSPRPPR